MLFLNPLLLGWPILVLLASTTTSRSKHGGRPKPAYLKTDHLVLQRVRGQGEATAEGSSGSGSSSSGNSGGLVWVDLENVRGKSGFALSHMDVLTQTAEWARHHELSGNVVVVADHGSVSEAYYLPKWKMAVVFSGNHQKADDVLAESIGMLNRVGNGNGNGDTTTSSSRPLLSTSAESIVITADNELQTRCRRASKHSGVLHIWDPVKFLNDLEATPTPPPERTAETGSELLDGSNAARNSTHSTSLSAVTLSLEEQLQLGKLDDEIRLRAQILDVQVQLEGGRRRRQGSHMTTKRRKKLQSKLNLLQNNLARQGSSVLDQVTSLDVTDDDTTMNSKEQQVLLQRWKEIQQTSSRREQTGDRVVLAEQFRRQLLEEHGAISIVEETTTPKPPAQAYVTQFNQGQQLKQQRNMRPLSSLGQKDIQSSSVTNNSWNTELTNTQQRDGTTTLELLADPSKNPLRSLDKIQIVALSDTHGFEGQLLTESKEGDTSSLAATAATSEVLPAGDILLHLGDFASEGSTEVERAGLIELDHWLALQPHPIKIVVRGNHDPWQYAFDQSGAWYITEPTAISLTSELVLGVIPYGSPRKLISSKGIPKTCDILATHVPPLKTLDRTCTGKSAGSGFLARTVREMKPSAPRLWLCGHIHEGRGVAERHFAGNSPTTVINAANANRGRATHLVNGAVVVELDTKDKTKPVEVIAMKDKTLEKRLASSAAFFQASETENGTFVQELLLAVDLGLKSGVSLFSRRGELLRYEQFYFDKDTLHQKANQLVTDWEQEFNDRHSINDEESQEEEASADQEDMDTGTLSSRITHIAIEGADGYMLRAWADAAEQKEHACSILRVSPEEWRAELLLSKERSSGSNAKAASRLIARQVVQDFGTLSLPPHQGKFPTDVAEAVCMGWYVARKLGWMEPREPAVRRYTNGNIVVPRK